MEQHARGRPGDGPAGRGCHGREPDSRIGRPRPEGVVTVLESATRDSATFKRFHFVGIGGAGMSGVALVFHARGYSVTGSDLKPSRYTALLGDAGIDVKIGHAAANVDHPDVVVISSAIPPHNAELLHARRIGLPVVKRAQALSWLMTGKRGIAVCGTHGKTTTTSMIGHILMQAGKDPTLLVGGELNDLGSNARHGAGEFVVCEADESDGSLLFLDPEVAVLLNLELDHHSHYLHVDDIDRVFREFTGRLPSAGRVVYWGDDRRLASLAESSACPTISFGLGPDNDYQAREVVLGNGGSRFEVWHEGRLLVRVSLVVPGEHNALNALAAMTTIGTLGIPMDQAALALAGFTGTVRRFQLKGERDGVTVVDDYAHHPTELRATLKAARTGSWQRVIAVFQPHLYSRTQYLQAEFARALQEADVAVVTDVYGAREEPRPGVSGKLIVNALLRQQPDAKVAYLPRLSSVVGYLESLTRPGDLVLTLGAGDVHRVGEQFLRQD